MTEKDNESKTSSIDRCYYSYLSSNAACRAADTKLRSAPWPKDVSPWSTTLSKITLSNVPRSGSKNCKVRSKLARWRLATHLIKYELYQIHPNLKSQAPTTIEFNPSSVTSEINFLPRTSKEPSEADTKHQQHTHQTNSLKWNDTQAVHQQAIRRLGWAGYYIMGRNAPLRRSAHSHRLGNYTTINNTLPMIPYISTSD